jgi:HEAT repeat protein
VFKTHGFILALLVQVALVLALHAQAPLDQPIGGLGSADPSVRAASHASLDRLGADAVAAMASYLEKHWVALDEQIDERIVQLQHPAWRMRQEASNALVEFGAVALEALDRAARSEHLEVAQRAQAAAEAIRADSQAQQRLELRMLQRRTLLELLAVHATADAVPVLLFALQGADVQLAAIAATGLGQARQPETRAPLQDALHQSRDDLVRERVIQALARLGDHAALAALARMARASDQPVYLRQLATIAVGFLLKTTRLAQSDASWLCDLLDDPSWEIRDAAISVLSKAAGTDHGYRAMMPDRAAAIARWREWCATCSPQ